MSEDAEETEDVGATLFRALKDASAGHDAGVILAEAICLAASAICSEIWAGALKQRNVPGVIIECNKIMMAHIASNLSDHPPPAPKKKIIIARH